MENRTVSLLWIALFAALTGIGAWIRIPFPPVPFTLQTLFVYLSGLLLGAKRGAASQVIFLILGLIGVPVFALGGGPGYILQPTFGYIIGFPVGAYLIGRMMEKRDIGKWGSTALTVVAGMGVIFSLGVLYLYLNLKWIVHQSITIAHALWIGCILFIPAEVIKGAIAIVLSKRLTNGARRFRPGQRI